ncbi:hypothetical protein GCM10010279_09460 [Streptomyces mutabilis]|nr:hypothetical protein GCM10010279_09460 [Streptomyces mutabilis]
MFDCDVLGRVVPLQDPLPFDAIRQPQGDLVFRQRWQDGSEEFEGVVAGSQQPWMCAMCTVRIRVASASNSAMSSSPADSEPRYRSHQPRPSGRARLTNAST